MDVLHLIKREHEGIRGLLNDLGEAKSHASRKKLLLELKQRGQMHLQLEGEYLYPEVSGLFNEASSFIKRSTENHKVINKTLSEVEKLLNKKPVPAAPLLTKKMVKLTESFKAHLDSEEELLMPKLRELIPTQDREDLGQVFLDVLEDQSLGQPKGRSPKRQ